MNIEITNNMMEVVSRVRGQEAYGVADSYRGAVALTDGGDTMQAGEGIAVTEEGEGEEIGQCDWDVLAQYRQRFSNIIPSFDVPTYSVHVDLGVHLSFHHPSSAALLLSHRFLQPGVMDVSSIQRPIPDPESDDNASLFSNPLPPDSESDDNASLFSNPLSNSDEESLFSDVGVDV